MKDTVWIGYLFTIALTTNKSTSVGQENKTEQNPLSYVI